MTDPETLHRLTHGAEAASTAHKLDMARAVLADTCHHTEAALREAAQTLVDHAPTLKEQRTGKAWLRMLNTEPENV